MAVRFACCACERKTLNAQWQKRQWRFGFDIKPQPSTIKLRAAKAFAREITCRNATVLCATRRDHSRDGVYRDSLKSWTRIETIRNPKSEIRICPQRPPPRACRLRTNRQS